MYYIVLTKLHNQNDRQQLIDDLHADKKSQISIVNYFQACQSHYDLVSVFECIADLYIDSNSTFAKSNLMVILADVDNVLLFEMKYSERIKFCIYVEAKDFINEHQAYFIYQIVKLQKYCSLRKSTRLQELANYKNQLRLSLKNDAP
ncbi:MAG TPA: hypothetical protein VIO87_03320 [Methylotenera sp.]